MANEENFAGELSTIDFDKIIGAPLTAVIHAQAEAAVSTLKFIQGIGFKPSNGGPMQLSTVDFAYEKQIPDANGGGGMITTNQSVTVPMLSMVPVPFIRVESLDIDLNVKLHSVQETTKENVFNVDSNLSFNGWFNTVKFGVTASDRNVSTGKSNTDKQYSLGVKVRAVQDSMPSGLARVLGIFDDLVQAKPAQAAIAH